jgi:Methyltransferase domain
LFLASFRQKVFVQKLLWTLQEIRDYARLHPAREMQRVALDETVDYIRAHMPTALGYYTSQQVLDEALAACEIEGHHLEFGVYKGGSLRYLARRIAPAEIHGFDSFEGLPEGWAGSYMGKGYFSVKGKLPRVPRNARLHAGWFDASLPRWLEAHEGPVRFLVIDSDLYSSAVTVLTLLAPRIRPGTVIVFDEYFNHPTWKHGEYKAFQEFAAAHRVAYDYLAYARVQVAVKIRSIG